MKPILFNTDMVRAILGNRKTVTRRVVKPQPRYSLAQMPLGPHKGEWHEYNESSLKDPAITSPWGYQYIPPYCPGNILYVRETWAAWSRVDGISPTLYYKADDHAPDGIKWRPSIHMPCEAARIFLRVTDVRVERLRDITELQILEKEGLEVDFPQPKPSYLSLAYTETQLKPAVKKAFADLWDSTIKKADRSLYGWDANPWVWAVEFERISREEVMNHDV